MLTVTTKELMIEHYKTIIDIKNICIIIQMKEYILTIEGKELKIKALSKYEIIIEGIINNMRFQYDAA